MKLFVNRKQGRKKRVSAGNAFYSITPREINLWLLCKEYSNDDENNEKIIFESIFIFEKNRRGGNVEKKNRDENF